MSKIGVEIARPVQDANAFKQSERGTSARRDFNGGDASVRAEDTGISGKQPKVEEAEDPKLKEFMEAMKPKSKRKAWEMEEQPAETTKLDTDAGKMQLEAGQSDEEYEEVPKKAKKLRRTSDTKNDGLEQAQEPSKPPPTIEPEQDDIGETDEPNTVQSAVTDSDWARSRTSRLLGLLDDEEEEAAAQQQNPAVSDDSDDQMEPVKGVKAMQGPDEPQSSMPTPPSDELEDGPALLADPANDLVRSSMRLFVRNLPYDVKEEDLEAEFASYGNLEEVRCITFQQNLLRDEHLIGTADASAFDATSGRVF